jgi:hypothetical protein
MTTQLLIQRVTNGIIVSEVVPGQPSIDLAACAVFPGVGNDLLVYLSRMLPIPPLASPPQVAEAVREVRDIINEQSMQKAIDGYNTNAAQDFLRSGGDLSAIPSRKADPALGGPY